MLNTADTFLQITEHLSVNSLKAGKNALLIGVSKYNTSTPIIKNNILNTNTSKVVIDCEKNLYNAYHEICEKNNMNVVCFDFEHDTKILTYNPFLFITQKSDIHIIATTFLKNIISESAFRLKEKEELLYLLINHLCRLKKYSLDELIELLKKCSTEYNDKTYMDFEMKYLYEEDETRILYTAWRKKYKENYIEIAKECLQNINEVYIKIDESANPYLLFNDLLTQNSIYFLNLPRFKRNTQTRQPWTAIFISQLFQFLQSENLINKHRYNVQFWQIESRFYIYDYQNILANSSKYKYSIITVEYAVIYFIKHYYHSWDEIRKKYSYIYYHNGGTSNQLEWLFMTKYNAHHLFDIIHQPDEKSKIKKIMNGILKIFYEKPYVNRLKELPDIIKNLNSNECLVMWEDNNIYLDSKIYSNNM